MMKLILEEQGLRLEIATACFVWARAGQMSTCYREGSWGSGRGLVRHDIRALLLQVQSADQCQSSICCCSECGNYGIENKHLNRCASVL